ncbi:hypothetical protein HPP92_002426 [Vanilla planifolia]|uniref:PROP1-like PPR domain-containing protein n=1 Tax=Vanilla planifolia TaxID=51239 RepID=A0A835RSK1_VANPL|nr:hypothetical protein HPP92_002426 [Vanilla planifolia]
MEVAAVPAKARKKSHRPEALFRHALDACSRNKDLSGALTLLESADGQNIHLTSYHFNSLLHILSTSIETLEDNDTRKASVFETAFKVFDRMVSSGATPTEATITTMARIASCRADIGGDMAFDLVKSMEEKYGAVPKLRTYDPALMEFCRVGNLRRPIPLRSTCCHMEFFQKNPKLLLFWRLARRRRWGTGVWLPAKAEKLCGLFSFVDC